MTNRVLVLGGTGRTGRHVIDHALAAGLSVHVLARRPKAVTQSHANLTVFEGAPDDMGQLDAAMAGCDAVIATMNNARASDSPFAKIVNSRTLLTDFFTNIITCMKNNNLRRIIHMSASGVGDSFEAAPWIFKQFIKRTNLGVAYADHESVEAALAASDLDWTIARPVGLSAKTGPVIESHTVGGKSAPKPSMQIGRDSVGEWMIEALGRTDLYGKAPVISQG